MKGACHVGWYGYNRREGATLDPGNWQIDSEAILGFTSDQMNKMADPKFRDIVCCDLIRPRTPLKLV